ncbi:hypothetical protein MnBA_38750 [Marinobacterium sp. BA1]
MLIQGMFTEDRIELMIIKDASMFILDPAIIGRGDGIETAGHIPHHGAVVVRLRLNVQTPRVVKYADSHGYLNLDIN